MRRIAVDLPLTEVINRALLSKSRDCGSVLSEDNQIGTIRSVEGSSTPIGGLPFLYCLGKGRERSFPLTSTYYNYKGWGGTGSNQISYPTAAFLNATRFRVK